MRISFSFEVGGSESTGRTSASKANLLSVYRCITLSLVLGLSIAARAILFFGYYGRAVDFVRSISVASIVWVVLAFKRYPSTWPLVVEFITAFIFFVLWLIVGILCIARYSTSLGIIGFVQVGLIIMYGIVILVKTVSHIIRGDGLWKRSLDEISEGQIKLEDENQVIGSESTAQPLVGNEQAEQERHATESV